MTRKHSGSTKMTQPTSDENTENILSRVRKVAAKDILFLSHAINQMNSPEGMISTRKVRAVIFHGVVVEDYTEVRRQPKVRLEPCL
jgi:hypothetical protein